MFITMMGINPASLKPLIKPFILGMGTDVVPLVPLLIDSMRLLLCSITSYGFFDNLYYWMMCRVHFL